MCQHPLIKNHWELGMGVRTRELRSNSDDRSWNKIIAWLFYWNFSHWLQFSKMCRMWAHFQFCDWQCCFHMIIKHQKAICVNTMHCGFHFEDAQRRRVSSLQTVRQNAVECNSVYFYHNLTSHHKKVQKKDASRLCSPEVLTSWGPPGGHKCVLGGLWETWDKLWPCHKTPATIKADFRWIHHTVN